tara:strand:+ start:312 stop:551 length:240 start_codon:yes stop_codon:yes gene_type:complete
MADHYIVKDGAWMKLNDTEFETEFGYVPTTPRPTEKLFNGRYENCTANTSSFNTSTGFPTNPLALINDIDNVFSVSGSM